MQLAFIDKKEIFTIDQLTKVQQEQLEIAGFLYDRKQLSARERLQKLELIECSEEGGPSFLGNCHLWKVMEENSHLFDAWTYMADCGAFFSAGTTKVAGEIIQFSPMNFQSSDIEHAVKQAMNDSGVFL